MRRLISISIMLFAGVFSAEAAVPVRVTLKAAKVVPGGAKRVERLVPADLAKPGDLLQYDAVYRNESGAKIANLQATLPIPVGLELLLPSMKPAGAQASLDGKQFASLPLMRTVTAPDGKIVREEVPVREYRALRWSIPQLAAGAQFTVSARAQVSTNARLGAK